MQRRSVKTSGGDLIAMEAASRDLVAKADLLNDVLLMGVHFASFLKEYSCCLLRSPNAFRKPIQRLSPGQAKRKLKLNSHNN